jgi:hypothetical protein
MGISCSSIDQIAYNPEVVRLLMPKYFSTDFITLEDRLMVNFSWQSILNNFSPYFLCMKEDSNLKYYSCITYFHDTFYSRLFDVHPLAKNIFKGFYFFIF